MQRLKAFFIDEKNEQEWATNYHVSRPALSGRDNFTTCLGFFQRRWGYPRLDTAGISHSIADPLTTGGGV